MKIRMLYITTCVWMLHTPNAVWNLLYHILCTFLQDFDSKIMKNETKTRQKWAYFCLILKCWTTLTYCNNFIYFSPFCSASPEKIGVKFGIRQKEKFFDTIYRCMWIFFFLLNLLPPYSLGLQGDYFKSQIYWGLNVILKAYFYIGFIHPLIELD